MKLSAKTYARLKDFAQKGGSLKNAGTIIGDTDPAALKGYMLHMKRTDPDLYKLWAGKVTTTTYLVPAAEKPKAKPAPKAKEATAGLNELFGDEPEAPKGKSAIRIAGKDYAERFRLRQEDGTDLELEVFSKHDRHGFILIPREA